ncbi:tetratricopeptide repeat protein [Balneola sp. MJW-20]|uniref:tetratricopeptide repeat protein n=1 Tax=Gracilimonas aurantiaca TaxID=3234185 RepID=UPI003466A58F
MNFVHRCHLLLTAALLLIPSLSGAQDIQRSPSEAYENGIRLFEEGFFTEAGSEFERFVSENPEHQLRINSAFYLARSKASGDSLHMESYYRDFIRQYPGSEFSVVLLQDLGHRLTDKAKYDEAIAYYQEALKSWAGYFDAPQTKYWVAEAAAENRDYNASRRYFLELADDNPRSEWAPRALYARGRLFLEEGMYDEASAGFELLEERYPNDPITRRVGTALGESYYLQGRYTEAVEALENAIPYLDEESRKKAVFLIAESHNYMDNYEDASRAYLQYANLTKGTPEERLAHYGLGWLYHRQEIYHWSAESFGKAAVGQDLIARKALYYKAVNEKLGSQYARSIETFRDFGDRFDSGLWVEEAYYEWSISAFEAGLYGESIETLLTLVRNQEELNDPGKIYTMLGEAYFANGEYTRATFAFDEAEKVTDLDPALRRQAQFQKAWILFRNQAYSQAQPVFEQVYTEAPDTELGGEALFWSADSYYKMNQFSRAAQRFRIFTQNYKDSELIGAARYSLGWSYFKMGNYENAIAPMEEFLANYNPPPVALFPYDIDTRLRIGDAYYAIGDYRNSIEYYNKAIGAEPGGDYAMFQVANSYYRAGRTFDAVSNFRKMLRIYPFSQLREQAQYNVAYIYLNTNNYSQAVEEFQTVISKYPGTNWAARSQYNIGDAFYNAGEYDRAIAAYKKVLEEYPRSPYIIEAINGIQYAQLSSGRSDSSSVILEDFLGDNPQSSTADRLRFRQAETVYQTGDYEGTVREFRQYLRVTNSEELIPRAYSIMGDAHQQLGQTDQAIESYESIINEFEGAEEVAPALTRLGELYYSKGDYQSSHAYYAQLLQKAPRFRQEAYIGMANASLASNEMDKAREEYESALQVNDDNEAAQVGLGKVAVREENYDRAMAYLVPVADKNTTEIGAEAQYYLGRIEQMEGNFESAIQAYSKVNVLFEAFDDWVSRAMYNTAECHIRLGNRGDAVSVLQQIVERYPGTNAAQRAQELLDTAN